MVGVERVCLCVRGIMGPEGPEYGTLHSPESGLSTLSLFHPPRSPTSLRFPVKEPLKSFLDPYNICTNYETLVSKIRPTSEPYKNLNGPRGSKPLTLRKCLRLFFVMGHCS